jgi:hypothetical protein
MTRPGKIMIKALRTLLRHSTITTLNIQQEEMKEDSGAANKKCKKRKLEEDSDDESMVDWIQEVGAVEIL